LAKQLKADFFLTNDEAARKVALKHKVRTKWLTEVLLEALKVGLIRGPQNFDEMLDKLVSKGLWIRKTLVHDAKKKARESSCVKG
jgi:predicted nucleic acid-binding protein